MSAGFTSITSITSCTENLYTTHAKPYRDMVGHLFQNYDTIYLRFFPTYTCNHSCYTIYLRFFVTYTCVLFPSIWPLSYKRAYICAQKNPYIFVTNKHVVYGVTESRHIRGNELYRQQKTRSCTMELKSNFSLNQAWPQFEQDLVLIHCPHSSGGCWLPDNGFVGIRGLFLLGVDFRCSCKVFQYSLTSV